MTTLELKIPPLALLLVFAILNQLLASLLPQNHVSQQLVLLPTLLLLLTALVFCLAGVVSFRRARTTVDPRKPEQSITLVSKGIYAITRNPMYVGFSLMLLAQSVYLQTATGLLLTVIFMAYLQRFQIQPEERALRELFGEAYTQYSQHVRRWL
jgi:protein-S-isoprenylcysteine O-methyltransferase Ste14